MVIFWSLLTTFFIFEAVEAETNNAIISNFNQVVQIFDTDRMIVLLKFLNFNQTICNLSYTNQLN